MVWNQNFIIQINHTESKYAIEKEIIVHTGAQEANFRNSQKSKYDIA